jgi:MFS family permease
MLYYGFAKAGTPAAIWVLFSLYGVFMGLTEGIQKGYFATIIPPEFKATAFGIYATAIGLATLPASLIGGILWDRVSPAATFYFGATTAAIATCLFLTLIILDSVSLKTQPTAPR